MVKDHAVQQTHHQAGWPILCLVSPRLLRDLVPWCANAVERDPREQPSSIVPIALIGKGLVTGT